MFVGNSCVFVNCKRFTTCPVLLTNPDSIAKLTSDVLWLSYISFVAKWDTNQLNGKIYTQDFIKRRLDLSFNLLALILLWYLC